ncbi:MAG: molybdopterin-dependent oxidoreductase [Candidatus Dormibacteraceae bacterium]
MASSGSVPRPHLSHWGAFLAAPAGDEIAVSPHPLDPAPSPLLRNLTVAARHRSRVARPAVRRGWLEGGPGPAEGRGREPFVAVGWDRAIELVAAELSRVRAEHGAEGIFGGSYGWASAGRFHHAQSQLHRFLNAFGGFVGSVNTYSSGAASVILPHVLADYRTLDQDWVGWAQVAERSDLVVAFGGRARKNSAIGVGGTSRHLIPGSLERARQRGCDFVLVSPLRDDLPPELAAQWVSLRPGTDVALMLGIAHVLIAEELVDRDFLQRCTTGFETFGRYVCGSNGGVAHTPTWAEGVCGVPAPVIVALARRMAHRRTLITVSHSLQRAEHGEQPVWMGLVLASMLGQIGLAGGGFGYALGTFANLGKPPLAISLPSVPQGRNPVRSFIPVARIADMLLHPGEPFEYDGQRLTYPSTRLVYWAGGNPFHHHQDLNRLRRAFARPDTIVVHDAYWTATARHADIVLPATVTLERDDLGAAGNDPNLIAMRRVVPAFAAARDDYAIFAELGAALGVAEAFTGGRSADGWLRHLYGLLAERMAAVGIAAPPFDEFWECGVLELPVRAGTGNPLAAFRADPAAHPLPTPSGRIEILSETIAGFGYDDCPPHPAWLPPVESPAGERGRRFPLQLIANQPASRLHSQLDFGETSAASKVRGREPIRLNPDDARARGIGEADLVRVRNDRGACLAGAVLSDALRPGVVQLSTGAWYEPEDPRDGAALCLHGNPNVLTRDAGTSRLAQGCSGQLTLVEVERWRGPEPPSSPHAPPVIIEA